MAREKVYVGLYFEDYASAVELGSKKEAAAYCNGVHRGAGEYGAGSVYAVVESEIDEELDDSEYDAPIKKALKKAIAKLKKK
jgi:hypothetical protein